jgi:PAS domain S-box-containing protein
VTSPTKGVLEVNEELCRILGYERSELLEKTWPEFAHPEDLGADVAQFNRVMAGEIDGYTLDKRWIRKDGRVIESIMAAKCLRRDDGSVNYFVGLVQDITERKHAEETLQNARAELAHMSRVLMIGEMAASIAHEVNQPLAAIAADAGACLRWLRREVPDLKEAENAAHRVMENALRAGDVIKSVRELVKRLPANQQPIHVNEIIRHVITLIDGELKKNEIALRMELEPDLPLVTGDRVQLEQVLLNLMINSKDAMTAGDWPARELLIRSQLNSAYELTVAVQDSGPGLRGRASEHIY